MRVLHLLACATLLGLANAQNASNGTNSTITYKGPEAAHYREYYYIGGQFISDGMGGQTVTHQMYVEELTPADGVTQQYPLIFVHGEPFCGAVWLNTPDGREGWASYFLKLGYKVILVDSPGSARSSKLKYEGSLDPYSVSTVESYFTLNRHPNYWSQSINHTQFPGNGSFGDPTFDIVYKSYLQIPDPTLLNVTASAIADAGAALLEKVGTSIIIGAGNENFALVIAEATPDKVKAVVQVEPEGPPFEQWTSNGTNITGKAHIYGITEKPLTFSPPVNSPQDLVYERVGVNSTDFRPCMLQKAPAKQLVNLARVPVLVVAGAASIAVPYIHCTVSFLQQAGVNVTYYRLDQLGIYGNGHFLFVELNNLVIADKLQGWLSQFTVGSG